VEVERAVEELHPALAVDRTRGTCELAPVPVHLPEHDLAALLPGAVVPPFLRRRRGPAGHGVGAHRGDAAVRARGGPVTLLEALSRSATRWSGVAIERDPGRKTAEDESPPFARGFPRAAFFPRWWPWRTSTFFWPASS